MINLKKRPIIRIIALVSAIFLLGQNIAWADPDIFFKNSLQPQTLFTRTAPEDAFYKLVSGYFRDVLDGIENDPRNRNLARIKSLVNGALKEMQSSQDIPEEIRKILPSKIKFYKQKAAVICDFGRYKIRYFNHNIPGTEIPEKDSSDFSYKVLQKNVGRYLSRQILIPEEGVLPSGTAVNDEIPADTDRGEGGDHDPDKVSKAVSGVSRQFDKTIEELKVKINEELSIEYLKNIVLKKISHMWKAAKKKGEVYIPPVIVLISGLGGGGKTTIVSKLIAIMREAGLTVKSEEYDNNILPEVPVNRRPLDREALKKDPNTTKRTEILIEKFEHDRFVESTHRLIGNEVVFAPVFDKDTRGRLEIERDMNGEITIHNGNLNARFVPLSEEQWVPTLIFDGREDSAMTMSRQTFHTREIIKKGGTLSVLGFDDTEYIIGDDKIGSDVVTLCSKKDSQTLLEKSKGNPDESDFEMINFVRGAHGKPVLEIDGEKMAELERRTLKFNVEKKGDICYLHVNNDVYAVSEEEWEDTSLLLRTRWFSLKRGERRDLLKKISPDSSIFIIEGVGTTSDRGLSKKAIALAIDADFDTRLVRMLNRFEEEKGRKIDRDEFIEKRLKLIRKEEAPYVIPWLNNCEYRVSSQSLFESVFVSYKKGQLIKHEELLRKLGLTAGEIEKSLKAISFRKISSLIEEKGFVGDSSEFVRDFPSDRGYFDELYTKPRGQYGLVVAVPTDEKVFTEELEPQFRLLKARLGGLMVRSSVINLSDSAIDVIAGELPDRVLHKLGEVVIKNSVLASTERVLRELLSSDDPRKTEKIKRIFDKFVGLQVAMAGRGIVDTCPSFKKYAFSLIPDERTGEERLILNSICGMSSGPSGYSAENYSLDRMTGLSFSRELVDYYNDLVSKKLPEQRIFTEKCFGKKMKECAMLPDPFDIDVAADQIGYLRRVIDQRKLYVMHRVFAWEREAGNLNKTESFFTWLELYRMLLEKQNKRSAVLLGKLYEKARKNPDIISNGKWIEDFNGLSGDLPLNEKYEIIKRIELFENDKLKISRDGNFRNGKEEKASLVHMLTSRIGGEVIYEELQPSERLAIDEHFDFLNIASGLDGVIFYPEREDREFTRAAGPSKWVKLLNAAYSEIKTRAVGSGVLAERLGSIRRDNRFAVEIKVAFGVPGNCARYKNTIFFDEHFARIIMQLYYGVEGNKKVSVWILAERLLHELSHTAGAGEEWLIEQDLAVYKDVIAGDPVFRSEISAYFREKNPAFASGNYFTFLESLSGLTDEREIDSGIRAFVSSMHDSGFKPSDDTSLIMVHIDVDHEPFDTVIKSSLDSLFASGLFNNVYEYSRYRQDARYYNYAGMEGTNVRIVEQKKSPSYYHIDNLTGRRFVVAGRDRGYCHYSAFTGLLRQIKGAQTEGADITGIEIHLPADAIYDYKGRAALDSDKLDKYVSVIEKYGFDFFLFMDGTCVNPKDKKTRFSGLKLYLWSDTSDMLKYLRNKKVKKQPSVSFNYRMPRETMEILKRKAGEAFDKGEITGEAYELFLRKGLGWIDEQGEIRIPHNLKIYVLVKEAVNEAAGNDVTGMYYRYMRYVRFYLSVYSAIEKFKTKHDYDIVERIMNRLRQYPSYFRLLELYRNRYGRFPDENGEEDERRLIASLVVTYAAGRALGKETVDLLDGEGGAVKLDDFWPLASYIIKDELWPVENGITRAKNAVLAKNADIRSSFDAAKERQEQFSKRIFDILRIKHRIVGKLLEAIRILEARLSEKETRKEYSWALEEDITCIKEYIVSSGRTIIDTPFLEKAFVDLRENLDVISSFDVFLRAAALVAACEQDKMMYTADLNFESALSAGMRVLNNAGKRLGILMAASGLNDRMLAKELGINPRNVNIWRNGRQRIPYAFLPALSEIFTDRLDVPVSASLIKHGKPLPELIRKISTFGERLYELRILAGLTLRQLSEQAHRDIYSINHWEREFHLPNNGMSFYNLALALDRHINEGKIEVTSLMFGISLDEFLKSGKVREPKTGEEVEVTQAMRIRVLRESSGLTQGGLAKKTGCDVTTVIRWENGKLIPGQSALWKLRDIFRKRLKKDIEIPWILYGKSLEQLLRENRSFGEKIRLLRRSIGLGIVQFSGAMEKAGHKISEDTIGKWESGAVSPKSWDSLMPVLGIYHERTGRYLDGTLLFYGKPLESLLDEVKISEGFKIIKYCRVSAGLTLGEISGRLGISPQTCRRWETGQDPVISERVIELSGILSEDLAKRDTGLSERLKTHYFEPLLLIPRNAVNRTNGPRDSNGTKKPRFSDRLLPKAAWDGKGIVENAGSVVSWLIQSMIDASENISIKEKNDKIVLFLDDDLTELNGKAAGNEVKKLIRMLAAVKNNNEDLRRFLGNLEIVRGRGRDILNKKGLVKAENVIVVTRCSNRKYFSSMKGRAVIAAIDNNDFPKSAYLPLLEVTLFAIGKYLGWDESMLRKHYENIPNAISIDDLNKEDYTGLFDPSAKDMVIRLIPNATAFDTRELVEMIERIRDVLRKA